MRFKKAEDAALGVIGEAIRRTAREGVRRDVHVKTAREHGARARTARACEEAEQGDIPAAARGGKAAKKATKKKTTKASAKR
jgi:hypothetical protein